MQTNLISQLWLNYQIGLIIPNLFKMDLRSQTTILRKKEQARIARETGINKRRESEHKKVEARQKQLEEERYDIKSTKAQKHSNKLRHEREKSLN